MKNSLLKRELNNRKFEKLQILSLKSVIKQHLLNQNATLEEIRNVAARICKDYLTGRWKVVNPEQLVVKRISGGLSNYLYYVSLPDDDVSIEETSGESTNLNNNRTSTELTTIAEGNGNKRQRTDSEMSSIVGFPDCEPQEVLLRIHGQTHGEDALEGMITESVVFALLSERSFGPKLLGIFPGGRIEQYIPARPLTTSELSDPKISRKIAERMGEIHSLNIPMSKEPDWLWNTMDRWMKSISSVLRKKSTKGQDDDVKLVNSFDFALEIKWLQSVINQGNFKVLFCHNDLQEGNILRKSDRNNMNISNDSLNSLRNNLDDSAIGSGDSLQRFNFESSSKAQIHAANNKNSTDLNATHDSANTIHFDDSDPDLMIIDFEYCAYNFRGFDLANHFLEWTFDYTNPLHPYFHHLKHKYPGEEQIKRFIAVYLRKLNENNVDYEVTEEEVNSIHKETQIFVMFSHLFWSLWSVINVHSNIEFGYWEYAVTRINEYKLIKQTYEDQQKRIQ